MHPVRILLSLLVVLALLGSALPVASADVVHLRTGEAVKGRPIQERSNDLYLTVEDYLTGAFRRFKWEAVDPADREEIKRRWNWTNTGELTIVGEVIEIRLDDGTTTEVSGLADGENETTVFLLKDGKRIEVPKSRIISRDATELDIRDVYTGKQLVEQLLESMKKEEGFDPDNLTSLYHWRLAQHAEWVGELETAKEHLEYCVADEGYLKRDLAAQRLARVEALLQDKAALATLRDAGFKLRMNLFRKTRAILDGFAEKHPEASEAVLEKLESWRTEFNERRTTELQLVAKRRFVKIVQGLIGDKVREKDVAITDLTGWIRRELPDQAFILLAEKAMGKLDDVTPEEAKSLWEGRPKRQWKRVTYGAGTFIVDPPKIKPPKRRRGGGSRKGGGGGQVQIPKPPTRDQWWEKASIRAREQWVLAYFVEQSELFELGNREFRPCPMCHGVGLLTKTLQTGDQLSYLCTRCGGAQQDLIIKYR